MILDLDKSKLLDKRDCYSPSFMEVNKEMIDIYWETQPFWLGQAIGWGKLRNRLERRLVWEGRRWEYPWAIQSADLEPGMRVLDACCGGSPPLIYLARMGLVCFGVDRLDRYERYNGIKELGLYQFMRFHILKDIMKVNLVVGYYDLSGRVRLPITYKKESMQTLSFADNFFDRVFCISTIEHIPGDERSMCIEQMMRVLRPGGKLIITMDMMFSNVYEYENIFRYCGINLPSGADHWIDHSIPASIRHPDWVMETVGLVMTKEEEGNQK